MIKYRTGYEKIEAIEVLRETEKCVYLPDTKYRAEHKELKRSEWTNWFDSWEEAHAFLVAEAEDKVSVARSRVEILKGRLGQIKGMKKP